MWTEYAYDFLGRTKEVTEADGVSKTTYAYGADIPYILPGNWPKGAHMSSVKDPAGKWKVMVNDGVGNLVAVLEPDPTDDLPYQNWALLEPKLCTCCPCERQAA